MSSVYATEPETSGKVVFETTHGPIQIALWPKEAPETTRVFLQLCVDGYFRNVIFHRVVPNLLCQTGIERHPRLSEKIEMEAYRSKIRAQEAADRRKFEVHSRLKFNHRGQVAMALSVTDNPEESQDDLQFQFFITLDEASFLDGKHVIFGTVTGPTMFNVIRIGGTEVDPQTNRPTEDLDYVPRITSVRIVDNVFHRDVNPVANAPWTLTAPKKAKKRRRQGKRDVNILSFGDDVEVGIVAEGDRRGILERDNGISRVTDVVDQPAERQDTAIDPEVPEKHARPDLSTSDDTDKQASKYVHKLQQPGPKKKHKVSLVTDRLAAYKKGRNISKKNEDKTMTKLLSFQNKIRKGDANERDDSGQDTSLASRMMQRFESQSRKDRPTSDVPTYSGQIMETDDTSTTGKQWMTSSFNCRRNMMDERAREKTGSDGRNADDYEVLDE